MKNVKYKSVWKCLLYHPVSRLVAGIVAILLSVGFSQLGIEWVVDKLSWPELLKKVLSIAFIVVCVIFTYRVLYRFYEHRKVEELSCNKWLRMLAQGFVLGALIQSLGIGIIYLAGGYHVESVNSWHLLISPLLEAFFTGVFEEILMRGILFRLLEEWLGSIWALLISAILFGAAHLGNANASLLAGISIALEAGLMLGVAYMLTRSLWFPIGIHWAWNFFQSGIYGASTSGNVAGNSLITARISGADMITGGEFGPEASVQAVVLGLLATVVMLYFSHRHKRFVLPVWKQH